MENKLQKKKGIDFGIQKRVVNFGESPFHIYSDDYNIYSRQFQTLEICSLVLHKIENYYGIMSSLSKNEKAKMNKKMSFFNYNLSLTQMGKNKEKEEESDADTNSKKNMPFIKAEEMDDDEVNDYTNIEDITESLYLSAYYHMDRGSGDIIEDISNNKNTAKISCIYNNNPNVETEKKKLKISISKTDKKEENTQEEDLKQIWSDVLEENDPLEYEDKWGRRSPPGHTIIFTKKLKTKISINNSNSLQHIADKFTIELWVKLKDSSDINIFSKEALAFDIDKGLFKLSFHGQEIPAEIIKQYNLPLDKFIHIAFLYKKTLQNIIVLLNCEEVVKFNFILSGLENNTPLVFGSERFDGEMTEIRIWNQRLPINFLKENYKTPLPILAEHKAKLNMNIENKEKKKNLKESVFTFGEKEKEKKNLKKSTKVNNQEMPNQFDTSPNNNGFDFNNNEDNIFGNELPEEEYPTMDLVSGNNCDFPGQNNLNQNNNSYPNQKDIVFQEDFNFDQ